jgi:CRISPR/Cas system-associated endonuclease Cas1
MPVKADLRAAQIEAVNDHKKKFAVARVLVQGRSQGACRFWIGLVNVTIYRGKFR